MGVNIMSKLAARQKAAGSRHPTAARRGHTLSARETYAM